MVSDQNRIKKIMLYAKITTLVELKEKLNLPYRDGTFTHIISGRNKISMKTAKRIHEVFPEISYEWICTGEGNFFSLKPTDPMHHKMKKVETELNEMKNKIDFVYNLKK